MTSMEETLEPIAREIDIPAKMGVAQIVKPAAGKRYAEVMRRLARLSDMQERRIQSLERMLLVLLTGWALSSIAWALS